MARGNGTAAACRTRWRAWSKRNSPNVGAVGVAKSGVRMLAAATLLEHGSDLQKKKFLRRILTGEDTWCQFFSEPGSGSDLAGATTRADLKGDFWIINGQKVWTTSAHHADHGLLLARTDWDAPKHEGLSYFVIDVKQPGVDVQPLKQMNGHASFNQVFFTDAKVPQENLVGRVGDGWKVAMTTLAHERRGADGLSCTVKARGARGTDTRRRARRNRKGESALQMVSTARRPRGSHHRSRQGDRREQGSSRAPGDRQADDHGEVRRVDRAARARRSAAGTPARSGRLARKARSQQRCARLLPASIR